jgi:hypothetical protein
MYQPAETTSSAANTVKINKNVNKMKLINDSINNTLALSQANVLI